MIRYGGVSMIRYEVVSMIRYGGVSMIRCGDVSMIRYGGSSRTTDIGDHPLSSRHTESSMPFSCDSLGTITRALHETVSSGTMLCVTCCHAQI